MTSQSGQQVITIHICLNILRSIGHQALKFYQLIKYKVKKKILPNHTEKEESRKASDHLFCLPKASFKTEASVQCLSYNIFL